jgi:hypothetical protein
VKPNNLQAAYTLISDFKQGRITSNSVIDKQQEELIQCLCEDLLPTTLFSVDRISDFVVQIAQADTHWNRMTQSVIDEFYTLRGAGKDNQAEQCRRDFLEKCPSTWYRGIVEVL